MSSGSFTLVVVMSPRHSGWLVSVMMVSLGWTLLHRRTLAPGERPVALRPLRAVLSLHLLCLAFWGASLAMRTAQWGYLPTAGVQKAVLCLGLILSLLAAHELAYTRRWAQIVLTFGVLAAITPSLFKPFWFQLPPHESTAVQLTIAALALVYPLLLLARRWVGRATPFAKPGSGVGGGVAR